jgi:signal transduction histidine kinase
MNQHQPNQSKGNILVVDDTPENLRLLVGILRKKGYEVRPVPSGELALSASQLMPPDLVLLDIMMPEMDGYEVCRRLKANRDTRDIPVIFISAINDILDKVKAFGVGGVDYITKPFQVEEVLARVETHLALLSLQRNLQVKNEDLAKTIQQLQATQNELIQSEKMAALGQLVAGIAHEINTPLGAIRSSVENIADFFIEDLEGLPIFFQNLSPQRQQDLLTLISIALHQKYPLSSREKRQIKKNLKQQLEAQSIDDVDVLASTFVNIGVLEDIQPFLSLLKDSNREQIFKVADDLASAWKSAKTIATATDRAAKVVFALKSYARYDHSGQKIQSNIIEGLETVLTLYQNQFKHGVEVIRNYDELPDILCYPDELNQVWTNLIHNALQAMNNKGTLTLDARCQDNHILITITDNGAGIPPEVMPRIFEPFFTTKPSGEGSGLGLDIVKKILEKHQGTITVESVTGQTQFTVSLPINLT